ncbi:hypothetical protein ABK040_009297 [Willaertia magna]
MQEEQVNSKSQGVLSAAGKGLSHLLSFSFLSKLITFVANTFIIRQLDPNTKGYIFKLELFVNTIIYLSSECFVKACLREKEKDIKNTSSLSILYGIITLIPCFTFWYYYYQIDYFPLIIYSISAMIEIFARPMYIIATSELQFVIKIRIEFISLFVKIITSALIVHLCNYNNELIIYYFGYSQLFYSISIFLLYLYYIGFKVIEFKVINFNSLKLVNSFLYQSFVKYFLTEGEKHVLMTFQSQFNQGVYDLISNLGSIAARLLFQYIEETGFSIWSKINHNENEKDKIDNELYSGVVLRILLKCTILLGCLFTFFGPSYSHTLIYLLYGKYWINTDASTLLGVYCFYILVMAVNGVTEAFLHASLNEKELIKLNYLMIWFSVIYLGISVIGLYLLPIYGTTILILANCFNMLMRITYSIIFILSYFKKESGKSILLQSLPKKQVLLSFLFTFILTKYLEYKLNIHEIPLLSINRFIHIFVGGTCLLFVLFMIYKYERNFVQEFMQFRRGNLHEYISSKQQQQKKE